MARNGNKRVRKILRKPEFDRARATARSQAFPVARNHGRADGAFVCGCLFAARQLALPLHIPERNRVVASSADQFSGIGREAQGSDASGMGSKHPEGFS